MYVFTRGKIPDIRHSYAKIPGTLYTEFQMQMARIGQGSKGNEEMKFLEDEFRVASE